MDDEDDIQINLKLLKYKFDLKFKVLALVSMKYYSRNINSFGVFACFDLLSEKLRSRKEGNIVRKAYSSGYWFK